LRHASPIQRVWALQECPTTRHKSVWPPFHLRQAWPAERDRFQRLRIRSRRYRSKFKGLDAEDCCALLFPFLRRYFGSHCKDEMRSARHINNTAIVFRHGLAEDAATLLEFAARIYYETFAPMNTPQNMRAYMASAFTLPQFKDELSDPRAIFILAEIEGKLA